jgi:hypothetical protein
MKRCHSLKNWGLRCPPHGFRALLCQFEGNILCLKICRFVLLVEKGGWNSGVSGMFLDVFFWGFLMESGCGMFGRRKGLF